MSTLHRSILAAVAVTAVWIPLSGRAAEKPDPKIISITLPDQIHWNKSANADTATIQGDTSKPGIYIQLIKWHPGNMSRPHTHPTDRYIYVLSGTWWIGWGPKYDPDSTSPVKAGTYVIDHANEIHYDGAKQEECELYIVGEGPLQTIPAGGRGK